MQNLANFPKVLLIIPTHDHASTLPHAIESALNQTFRNIEIVVIGDGVNDNTRSVMSKVLVNFPQVKFVDKPKSLRHGEEYRDELIRNSDADFISYLGDDDLLFPDHLKEMLRQVKGVDFANPLPIFIEPNGELTHIATDLSQRESVTWHLQTNPSRNSVSLTGVIHSKESYLKLPFGWRAAPQGIPSDLYMWHQYFRLDGFVAKTAPISTTAKFASQSRTSMSGQERSQELLKFAEFLKTTNFRDEWDRKVQDAVRMEAIRTKVDLESKNSEIEALRTSISEIYNSVSWKSTSLVRKLFSLLLR